MLGIIKMKFDQLTVYRMVHISNLFLALLWTLETSFMPFYGFDEMGK